MSPTALAVAPDPCALLASSADCVEFCSSSAMVLEDSQKTEQIRRIRTGPHQDSDVRGTKEEAACVSSAQGSAEGMRDEGSAAWFVATCKDETG